MFSDAKREFVLWAAEINRLIRSEVLDLQPREYCYFAVIVIAIGFVTLSGRR